jgi:hypothetical protein
MRFLLAALLFFLPAADLTLVRTTDLEGNTRHVQGIDFDERRLWVTSVDKEQHKGYLQEFSLATGKHLRTEEVSRGIQYHPGGLSLAGDSLWLPVAEYRRESTSVVQKRSTRTLKLQAEFTVADHIGCVAAGPDFLIGANWDSRDFYIWDTAGGLIRKVANPTTNGYQDLKFDNGRLVASGLLPVKTGAIDWLEYPSLRLLRRIPAAKTSRNVPYTAEGMAIRGARLFLLPEDSPSRLFEFRY